MTDTLYRYRQLKPSEVHPREREDAQALLQAYCAQVRGGLAMPELHFMEPVDPDAPLGDDFELTSPVQGGGYFESDPPHHGPTIWIQRGYGYWQMAYVLAHEVGHAIQAAFPSSHRFDDQLGGKNAEAKADSYRQILLARLHNAHVAAGLTPPATL